MTLRDRAIVLSIKLQKAKAGLRFKDKSPKVRPTLSPADRDVIVLALQRLADAEALNEQLAEKPDAR